MKTSFRKDKNLKEEYKLEKCYCSGRVELNPSKPWNQDPSIHCTRCGGTWKHGTYSDVLTIEECEEWNKLHR